MLIIMKYSLNIYTQGLYPIICHTTMRIMQHKSTKSLESDEIKDNLCNTNLQNHWNQMKSKIKFKVFHLNSNNLYIIALFVDAIFVSYIMVWQILLSYLHDMSTKHFRSFYVRIVVQCNFVTLVCNSHQAGKITEIIVF